MTQDQLAVTFSEPPAKQLAAFIAKFDPAVAKLIRAVRSKLRARLPTAIEQVYDNYNFLAIGFCTTERTSDCIVSLAVSAKGVALSFYYGASLPDPGGILLGSGKQNRFLRLVRGGGQETRAGRGGGRATDPPPGAQRRPAPAPARPAPPLASTGRGHTLIK